MEGALSPVYKQLSAEKEEERADILTRLKIEPPSSDLLAYFKLLKARSTDLSEETFIDGMLIFANICGCERAKYYPSKIKGIHYPTTFTTTWNQIYPQHPITVWEGPFSQGLNDILAEITTVDCGMWTVLEFWFGLRYMLGDASFDILFPFKNGQFTLSQCWDEPTNAENAAGNLLFPLYVTPFYANLLGKSSRIETKTVWNHPDYSKIHPGGMTQLYNSNWIDGKNIAFDSDATENILSDADLEERLRMRCNAPRDLADMQKLWLWREFPEYEHPHFAPKTFGMLAWEAEGTRIAK
jgi:hypothetical protein